MIEVKIKQDEDGHDYVIPVELNEEFEALLESDWIAEYTGFNAKFSQYRRSPDELKLYTDEI